MIEISYRSSVVIVIIFALGDLNGVYGNSDAVIDLTGQNWTLSNATAKISNIKLPSGVYSALYGEEVLRSYNDINMRWIAHGNWTYSLNFSINPVDFYNVRCVNLTFHGIDTVAEIRLNHHLLGLTDNMFVRYTYSIKNILEEDNLLEVEIKSPISAALERARTLTQSVPPECPSPKYNGECHMNMLRKMQASFAWDWGLAAPSIGIWKEVVLEKYDAALIRDVDVAISRNTTHWNMQVRVYVDAQQDFYGELTFYAVELLKTPVIISDYVDKPISRFSPMIQFDQAVPIENVVVWWPNGYGEQKLYPLHISLKAWTDKTGPVPRSKIKSQKSIVIGFRTIELVEDIAPSGDGNTFLFKVNGVEMFMKGSNYIPAHILPELGRNEQRIRFLLQSAKEAHMNMLRVWGGGIYESDYFYSLADEYGIFIWQDMMFACAMYPIDDAYLSSVRLETQQNAKRLAHHPSIAIFATNNENEIALVQNWYPTRLNHSRFETEYRILYVANVLHELKMVEHNSRPKPLVSSPSNGKEEEKYNYISADPQDPHYGDVHFYDVVQDGWNPDIYPRPRFASEYGFQSLPKLQSWNFSMTEDEDLIDLVHHRQHHPLDMLPIKTLIQKHLPLPLPEDDGYAEALIYFSQICQAMATKVETELYRTLRDTPARTMGALYWQLNDVWVAPSWSSIDFYGNYKLLHYWARDFLAPTAISALYSKKAKAIHVNLICDELKVDTKGLQVAMNIYKWSTLYPCNTTIWDVTLRANGVQYDKVIPIDSIFQNEYTKDNSFFEFMLIRQGTVISTTYTFPQNIAAAKGVVDPALTLDISMNHCVTGVGLIKNSYSLTINVNFPAIFVYIEVRHPNLQQYKLSRNGYMQMLPVQIVHLEFDHRTCLTLESQHIKVLTVNQFMV